MNKTDTLMWLMRAHEAIRKLPADTKFNDVDIQLYGSDNKIRIFLDGETEIKNVVRKDVLKYRDCHCGRVEVSDSYGVEYWWGVDFDDDGNVIPRA